MTEQIPLIPTFVPSAIPSCSWSCGAVLQHAVFLIVNRNAMARAVRTGQYHDSRSNHVRRAHHHGIDPRPSPSGTGTTIDRAAFISLHNASDS